LSELLELLGSLLFSGVVELVEVSSLLDVDDDESLEGVFDDNSGGVVLGVGDIAESLEGFSDSDDLSGSGGSGLDVDSALLLEDSLDDVHVPLGGSSEGKVDGVKLGVVGFLLGSSGGVGLRGRHFSYNYSYLSKFILKN
jgi:hypothetical protein